MVHEYLHIDPDGNEPYDEEGEKWITVNISNESIKLINSALRKYKGDLDDSDFQQFRSEVIDDVHEIWTILNPS